MQQRVAGREFTNQRQAGKGAKERRATRRDMDDRKADARESGWSDSHRHENHYNHHHGRWLVVLTYLITLSETNYNSPFSR